MRAQLVLVVVIFVLAFRIDCVQTIKCFVCNSHKEKGCETGSLNQSYLIDCEVADKNKYDLWTQVIEMSKKSDSKTKSKSKYTMESEFLTKYSENFRSKQCVKIVMTVDDSGSKTDRVFRGCTGLVCRGQTLKGKCLKVGTDPKVKSEQCYCESDGCNSTHRRLHPNNFWLNILLPIIISLSFVFNFY